MSGYSDISIVVVVTYHLIGCSISTELGLVPTMPIGCWW